MKLHNKTYIFGSLLSSAAVVFVPSVSAQNELETIVVTARKQPESLQTVPLAVSAFTDEGMKNRGLESSADIGNFIPNVQFDSSSSFAGTDTFQAYIRGIGQSDFAINTDPGVAVYVDGVYYARASSSVVDLLDVERIEVLKGPQGTLFGRNSIGGAVSITTKRPDEYLRGSANVTVGTFGRTDLNAVINLPLSDVLLSSFAVATNSRDGYQRRIPFPGAVTGGGGPRLDQILVTDTNNSNSEAGGIDSQVFRAKLLWLASDDVEVMLAGDYNRSRNDSTPVTVLDAEVGLDKPGGLVGLYNGCVVGLAPASICDTTPYFSGESLPYDNRFLTDDIDTTYATGANFSNDDSFGLSAKVSWQLSDVFSAVSITAYREVDSSFGADIDSSPAIYDQPTFAIEQSQVSQEFLLKGEFDDINFTVGAMYFTEDATQADNVAIAAGLIQIAGDNSQEVTSLSFFGEANYSITDDVTLVFGGRYTDEDKELELNQRSLNPDFFVSTGFPVEFFPRDDRTFLGPADTQRANFTNTSIRVGADWQIDEELFTYLTFSQGFKSGGFTTRLTAPFNPVIALNGLSDLGFDEETVDSFEVGFKSEFLDGRLRMNAAAFFNTYKDIQIVVQRGITPANENAGEAEIKGVELEMEAVLGEQVYLTVALGYQNAEYTELDPLLSESEFGSFDINAKLANTPELTGSVSLNWAVGYVAGGELEYNLNYSYTDDVYNDTANTEALFQKASAIMGTSLSWVSNDYTWNARLGVTNLTNKRRLDSGFDGGSLNFVGGTYNRPREVYFTVGYDY